jgi:hypothetical protein
MQQQIAGGFTTAELQSASNPVRVRRYCMQTKHCGGVIDIAAIRSLRPHDTSPWPLARRKSILCAPSSREV